MPLSSTSKSCTTRACWYLVSTRFVCTFARDRVYRVCYARVTRDAFKQFASSRLSPLRYHEPFTSNDSHLTTAGLSSVQAISRSVLLPILNALVVSAFLLFVSGNNTTWRSFVPCQQHADLLRCSPRLPHHSRLEHGVEAVLYGGAARPTRLTRAAQHSPEQCNARKAASATKIDHLAKLSIHQRPDRRSP